MSKAKNIILFIFGIVFCVLLFIALVRATQYTNGYNMTFTGFLEFLSNTPTILPPVNISNFMIVNNWGILNGLRDFFNLFAGAFGIIVWLGASVFNIFGYIFYFIKFIFAF